MYDQLKSLRKTGVQESVSKNMAIRVFKNKNRELGKMTGRPEALSVRGKRRIRRTLRQLIRQDELVTSRIIKNKTGVTTASCQTICQTLLNKTLAMKESRNNCH